MGTSALRWMSLVFFGVLLMGVLAGCGGGSSGTKAAATTTPPATITPSSTTPSGAAGFAAYAKCLADHGVASVGGRGNGSTSSTAAPTTTVDPAVMNAARTACDSLRPAAGAGGGGGFGGNTAAAAAYRNCLQLHDVTIPTNGTPGSAGTGGFAGGVNQNDPAFQAATQACASLRPARPATTTAT